MQEPIKSRETQSSFEINWKIREFFSESALACFFTDIEKQNTFAKK